MACTASFPREVPLECAKEVIGDFRARAVSMKTLTKLAFAVGCLAAMAGGGSPLMALAEESPAECPCDLAMCATPSDETLSVNQMCDAADTFLASADAPTDQPTVAFNPFMALSLLKLLLSLGSMIGQKPGN